VVKVKDITETDENRRRAFLAKSVERTAELKKKIAEGEGPRWKHIVYSIHPVAWIQYSPHKILAILFSVMGNYFGLVGRVPGVRKVHPWTRAESNSATYLPIAENVEVPDNVPLPLELMDLIIETASHRVVFDCCICRTACNCKHYPAELGCMMFGDGAVKKEIMGNVGHEVGITEAKEYVRKAVSLGLIPSAVKAKADSYLFGFRDTGRVIVACFCCECCCIAKVFGKWNQQVLDNFLLRVEGATIEISRELCIGCEQCVEKCNMHAISIVNGKAVVNDKCRICSRCASVCSTGAIKIALTDPDWVDKVYERLLQYSEFREGH
jgi:UDP-glucose 4-epimerase